MLMMEPVQEEDENSNHDSLSGSQNLANPDVNKNHKCSDQNVERSQWSAAVEEWAEVEERAILFTEAAHDPLPLPLQTCSRIITFEEVLEELSEQDLSEYSKGIKPTKRQNFFKRILRRLHLYDPPALRADLIRDRDQIFTLAKYPFQNDGKQHLQALQTVYKKLTNADFDCPRFGNHWEQIGFQGTDPATDLRGAGTLGLLQLLYLSMNAKYNRLVSESYSLSRDARHNFPFSVMSINMTKIALEALREEILNKECNASNDVWETFNRFYVATFLQLHLEWQNRNATIGDSGYIIQSITKTVKTDPQYAFYCLNEFLEKEQAEEADGELFSDFTDITIMNP